MYIDVLLFETSDFAETLYIRISLHLCYLT